MEIEWKNPKKELPKAYHTVLLKIDAEDISDTVFICYSTGFYANENDEPYNTDYWFIDNRMFQTSFRLVVAWAYLK